MEYKHYLDPVREYLLLFAEWEGLSGEFDDDMRHTMLGISKLANAMLKEFWYLSRLNLTPIVYKDVRIRFPKGAGSVDPFKNATPQYVALFEQWQDACKARDKEFMATIADDAQAIRDMCAIEIGKVVLPEEPRTDKYIRIEFHKPLPHPATLIVEDDQTKW